MILVINILALAGMILIAEGIVQWRRQGFRSLVAILAVGGAAMVSVYVGYQHNTEVRFISSLKPSMNLDLHPPPLSPEVRPPTLKAPGQERAWDSMTIA